MTSTVTPSTTDAAASGIRHIRRHPHPPPRPVGRRLEPRGLRVLGIRGTRRSPAATSAGRSSPSSSASSSGSCGASSSSCCPAAGFDLTSSQLFWLISVPSLVGATLRFPYTFMVAIFGGRNWTIVSAGLLLIPAVLLGIVVSNPETPFGVLLLVAALGGVGGGNFASSMANITYFFPQKEKGWALGLNAAGGNLGTAVAQFAVPDRRHDRRRRHDEHRARGLDVDPPDPRRDVGRVALHGQPVVRQGRLRGLRRRAARTAPVAHVAALHRHLRLVHRVRERLPEAHRRSVPGVLHDPGRAGGCLARVPRRPRRLARPPLRRPARRPLRRLARHRRRLRGDGARRTRAHPDDGAAELLGVPRLLPPALRRHRRRQRLDLPDDPEHLRRPRASPPMPCPALRRASRCSASRRRRSASSRRSAPTAASWSRRCSTSRSRRPAATRRRSTASSAPTSPS